MSPIKEYMAHLQVSMQRQIVRQFIKYGVTGGLSFLLEYAIFYVLLVVYSVQYLLANTVAYGTVFAFNFALNRIWTFKSSGNLGRQMRLYAILLVFNLLATNLLLHGLVAWISIPSLYAKVLVMGCVVLWNFVLYKKVIYR